MVERDMRQEALRLINSGESELASRDAAYLLSYATIPDDHIHRMHLHRVTLVALRSARIALLREARDAVHQLSDVWIGLDIALREAERTVDFEEAVEVVDDAVETESDNDSIPDFTDPDLIEMAPETDAIPALINGNDLFRPSSPTTVLDTPYSGLDAWARGYLFEIVD